MIIMKKNLTLGARHLFCYLFKSLSDGSRQERMFEAEGQGGLYHMIDILRTDLALKPGYI